MVTMFIMDAPKRKQTGYRDLLMFHKVNEETRHIRNHDTEIYSWEDMDAFVGRHAGILLSERRIRVDLYHSAIICAD